MKIYVVSELETKIGVDVGGAGLISWVLSIKQVYSSQDIRMKDYGLVIAYSY